MGLAFKPSGLFDSDISGAELRGRRYLGLVTSSENRKGVLDVDTVKGCGPGMTAHPEFGCYDNCYAARTAKLYGIDFSISVSRRPGRLAWRRVWHSVRNHYASWYRVGTAGDPSIDWENTLEVIGLLKSAGKVPVIITKHWQQLSGEQLARLAALGAVVNTSVSALDTPAELAHRLHQIERLREAGVHSVARVVTCKFGNSEWGREANDRQRELLSLRPLIDNPLRLPQNDQRVIQGDITVQRIDGSIGGGRCVSLHDDSVFLGHCRACPDQCGSITQTGHCGRGENMTGTPVVQKELFSGEVRWLHLEQVIGSGYEDAVSKLAIEDGIAKRAARRNMQIHSAIVLLLDGEFAGFFTFQVNHVSREFCLLQSVIEPARFTPALYEQMAREVVARNTWGYPALITTDPKSKFETPALFESLGFQTYLKMSGFHYMVRGELSDVRMKLLAHITMTNVWKSTKGDWLRLKSEWRERIDSSGEAAGVANPAFATREGCWQGTQGMANVVTKDPTRPGHENGRDHNGNASVLDPVACEVIARFFMPSAGGRVYNPFGGGVQFGYVAGASGYEYVASEIRKNQCDANNLICREFPGVKWVNADSATYEPEGMFDLVFTCPPYYRVERYVDYDGMPPAGEINTAPTYDEFRELLFAGYRIAIDHLNDNRFFVVMTGDSRDKKGAYYCAEAETELFMKQCGLSVYNRIVYLEAEFTRLAHAKKTLHVRKFPKREQKIIVGYKGSISEIPKHFAPIGRL